MCRISGGLPAAWDRRGADLVKDFGAAGASPFQFPHNLKCFVTIPMKSLIRLIQFAAFEMLFALVIISSNCHSQPADTNYDESKVPQFELPTLLTSFDGKSVATAAQWSSVRRKEILQLFEKNVFGKTPRSKLDSIRYETVETASDALDGIATRLQIRVYLAGNERPYFDLLLYIPNSDQDGFAAPCFLGLNFSGNQSVIDDPAVIMPTTWIRNDPDRGIAGNRASEKSRGALASRWPIKTIIDHGYALATIYYGDIDPDNYAHDFSDGIHPLFYQQGQTQPRADQWGSIGAWAWGLSRALDYLETNPRVDAARVCVFGHSRLGKTALWAGAQDTRFAMVISNNSGCGGAALYRRCFGERIHHMVKPIGYWFCKNHHAFAHRESELPVDQHMLIALVAPRAVYVASATEDLWADPKGEFLSAKFASPAYKLFGFDTLSSIEMPRPNEPLHTRIGYHLRKGRHDITLYDWQQYLNFADRHFNAAKK